MESYRLTNGLSAKRQVLYLGEINATQKAGWCRITEAFERGAERPQIALFPSDRVAPAQLPLEVSSLNIDLSRFELHRPRQWGDSWLSLKLWDLLELDHFFTTLLTPKPKGTRCYKILQLLVCNRCIAPGSEWFVHSHCYRQTGPERLAGSGKRCRDPECNLSLSRSIAEA